MIVSLAIVACPLRDLDWVAMRRYSVTTFGCQMNVHDSERMKGLLESLGLGEATAPEDADVLVFNTCTIREKADERFHARLMDARAAKLRDPSKVIVVGGCWSESIKDELFELYPFVDLAYGPGNISRLGEFIQAGGDVPRGHFSTFDEFSGDLPMRRERPFQAWLQISQGCNSTCSYCIVPSVRGREQSRPADVLVAEAERFAAEGVRELTLLGQNVNSWGRDLPVADRRGFGELLRLLDARARHRAHPLHEPAPQGHARRRDCRPPRVRLGLRARAPAAAVGLHAHPQGDAPHVLARALRRARAAAARGGAGPRAHDRRDRRLPGRERGRLRRDARGLRARSRSTTPSRSSTRRGGARTRRAWTTRSPRTSSASAWSGSSRSSSVTRTRATRSCSARCRRCSSKGPSRTDPERAARPHAHEQDGAPDAAPSPASSCTVRIEAATSQTLRGVRERVPAAV